jgi:UDP-N-acetylmuramoyl-tripeptide--D-alanyl-D-alanine ligase
MKFMQQDDYYNYRLFRFAYRGRNLIDTRVSIPMLIAAVAAPFLGEWALLLPIAALAVQIFREQNPTKTGIKPLNMTARVKRIFWTAFVLWCGAVLLVPVFHFPTLVLFAALVLLAPIFVMLGNTVMMPVEKIIRQRYINEAKAILDKYKPVTIGITGSFGKTSLKNILAHILGSYGAAFATKRSINTLMGIVRVIREEMPLAAPKYFVAEMGIGDTGQMPALVKFINPRHGIITAIGAAHLSNFKTLDKVAREKFRLADMVRKNGGRMIINAMNVDAKYITRHCGEREARRSNPNLIIFTGEEIENTKQTIDGISFTLKYEDKEYEIAAPIYGLHQAENLALAFIMARAMDIPADNIILALKTLKQTEHRLELKRENGMIILDDAFNSNVKGFVSAVETGNAIKGENRLIIITPGMVDQGSLHAENHKIAGAAANKFCDVVIAVNSARMEDFTNEISKEKLILAENLTEAREWLSKNGSAGDIVLYENDLPDLYIEKIKI